MGVSRGARMSREEGIRRETALLQIAFSLLNSAVLGK
jgi:hypothetical protein